MPTGADSFANSKNLDETAHMAIHIWACFVGLDQSVIVTLNQVSRIMIKPVFSCLTRPDTNQGVQP